MMTIFTQTNELTFFNAGEAAWWFLMAAFVMIYWRHWRGMTPGLRNVLAIFLMAFGVSDVIEMRTGAWWRPLSLLIFKVVCLTGIVGCGVIVFWRRNQDKLKNDTLSGHK